MSTTPRTGAFRASLNNFVGIFGRQAPISGLVIPRWITIYVDQIDEANKEEIHKFLKELVEGCGIVGATGVTVVFRLGAEHWYDLVGDGFEKELTSLVIGSRPYFRAVVCNHYAANDNRTLPAGALIVLTDGSEPRMPESLAGRMAVCLDFKTTLISKTMRPEEVVRDAIQQVADVDVREKPHWTDPLSTTLLNSTACLLALNVLCKPERFGDDTFFFAYDYLDETVCQAFNDRGLRMRRRSRKQKSRGNEPDAEAAEEAAETETCGDTVE